MPPLHSTAFLSLTESPVWDNPDDIISRCNTSGFTQYEYGSNLVHTIMQIWSRALSCSDRTSKCGRNVMTDREMIVGALQGSFEYLSNFWSPGTVLRVYSQFFKKKKTSSDFKALLKGEGRGEWPGWFKPIEGRRLDPRFCGLVKPESTSSVRI